MPAEHHQLLFELGIDTRDLREGIVALVIVVIELSLDVDFHLHRHLPGQQAHHAAVVLDRDRDTRERDRLALVVASARLDKDGAILAGLPGKVQCGGYVLIGEELLEFTLEAEALRELLPHGGVRSAWASGSAAGNLKQCELRQFGVVVALEHWLFDRLRCSRLADQHDLACQFALVFLEVGGGCGHQLHHLAPERAVRSRCPGFRQSKELHVIGRDHADLAELVGPTAAESAPGLHVGVDHAPFGELVARPLVGLLHIRRARESGAYIVGDVTHEVHHLAVVKFLIAQARDEFKVRDFRLHHHGSRGLAGRSRLRFLRAEEIAGEKQNGSCSESCGHYTVIS